MPGEYDVETRTITLQTKMTNEPRLTAATIVHHVVCDLLHQKEFGMAHFPELVDIASIGTGLGVFYNKIELVKAVGGFWDSTYWGAFPRPFLDSQALAYVNAMTAWIRGDKDPTWGTNLRVDLIKPMKKSLKYLHKTDDSFFRLSNSEKEILKQDQRDWIAMAESKSVSTQVIAVRHLENSDPVREAHETLLVNKLMSPDRDVVLNTIAVVEKMKFVCDATTDELRLLCEHRDDEIRSKAMYALAKLELLDESTTEIATKMIGSSEKFVSFAGGFALASLKSAPEHLIPFANRGFLRALQSCDYEFVGLYAAAFNRWFDDPKQYIERLLKDDSPDYVEVGLEALENVQKQLVNLS